MAARANARQAVLAASQAKLAAAGEWALNEKRLVARAGLDDAQRALTRDDAEHIVRDVQALLGLGPWR